MYVRLSYSQAACLASSFVKETVIPKVGGVVFAHSALSSPSGPHTLCLAAMQV